MTKLKAILLALPLLCFGHSALADPDFWLETSAANKLMARVVLMNGAGVRHVVLDRDQAQTWRDSNGKEWHVTYQIVLEGNTPCAYAMTRSLRPVQGGAVVHYVKVVDHAGQQKSFQGPVGVVPIAIGADGDRVAYVRISGTPGSQVLDYLVIGDAKKGPLYHESGFFHPPIQFSPEGAWLAYCVGDKLVMREIETGREMRKSVADITRICNCMNPLNFSKVSETGVLTYLFKTTSGDWGSSGEWDHFKRYFDAKPYLSPKS